MSDILRSRNRGKQVLPIGLIRFFVAHPGDDNEQIEVHHTEQPQEVKDDDEDDHPQGLKKTQNERK